MVDSALVWICVTAVCGLVCLAGTLREYVETGHPNYWGLGATSVAAGGIVELLAESGYVADSILSNSLRLLLFALALVFVVAAFRTHGTNWRLSTRS